MMTIGVASAVTCSNETSWINGSILDADNSSAISGVYVRNASNATTGTDYEQASAKYADDTTGTDGYFNLSCFSAGAAETIYFNRSGYIERSLTIAAYNGTGENGALLMTPRSATLSGAASSSITRNTATFSWTATASDNVSNNAIGNRIVYMSGGITNITSSWSNTTTTPSISLTALREGQTYTVYYESYSLASAKGRTMSSTTFTTLKSKMGAIIAAEEAGVPAPAKPSGALEILTSPNKTPQQRNIIIVAIVAIVGIIIYFGYLAKGGGKGSKKK